MKAWSDRLSGVLRVYLLPVLLVAATFSDFNFIHLTHNNIPVRLSIGDLGIALSIGLVLILWQREILARIRNNRVLYAIAGAFIAIAFVSGLFSGEYWLASVKCCLRVYLLLLLLMASAYETYLSRGTLICLFVYLISINIVGCLEYFFPEHLQAFLLLFRDQESLKTFKYLRAGSVFPHPNHYGGFNALALVTILAIQFGFRKFITRPFFWLISMALILGILFSGSRNAIMVVLIGTVLLSAFLTMQKRYRDAVRLLIIMGAFSGIILGGVLLNIAGLGRIMNHVPALESFSEWMFQMEVPPLGMNDEDVLNDRGLIWKEGWRQYKEHPLLGLGANEFKYRNQLRKNNNLSTHMHSLYGELLVDQGIIGFGLVITLCLFWFVNIRTFWQVIILCAFLAAHVFAYFVYFSLIGLVSLAWLVMITTRPPRELFVEPYAHIGNSWDATAAIRSSLSPGLAQYPHMIRGAKQIRHS